MFREKAFYVWSLNNLIWLFYCLYFKCSFDGIIDMHAVKSIKYYEPFLDNGINIICLAFPLFILGRIVNRKVRGIDILNSVLLSRIPFYLLPLFNFNDRLLKNGDQLLSSVMEGTRLSFWQIFDVLLFSVVALAALVLFIWWLFIGFKTATNSKKNIHKLFFAGCVILAEVISKIIFSSI